MTKLIPRFIYHLTTRSNYEKIISTGKLLAKNEELAGKAVFMFDMKNLSKCWRSQFFHDKKTELADALVNYVKKDDSGFALLRIPTSNLSSGKLRVRSQKRLFSEAERLCGIYKKKIAQHARTRAALAEAERLRLEKSGLSRREVIDSIDDWYLNYEKRFPIPKIEDVARDYGISKCTLGETARKRKLYEQRKEAIEYIYPEDITTGMFTKIGECDSNMPANSIFSALIKGTPEEKMLFG